VSDGFAAALLNEALLNEARKEGMPFNEKLAFLAGFESSA